MWKEQHCPVLNQREVANGTKINLLVRLLTLAKWSPGAEPGEGNVRYVIRMGWLRLQVFHMKNWRVAYCLYWWQQHEEGKLPQASGVSVWRPIKADRMPTRLFSNHAVHCTAVSILNRPIPRFTTWLRRLAVILFLARLMRPLEHELSEHVALALKNRKGNIVTTSWAYRVEANLEKALWLAHEVEALATLLTTLAITDPVPMEWWRDCRSAGEIKPWVTDWRVIS